MPGPWLPLYLCFSTLTFSRKSFSPPWSTVRHVQKTCGPESWKDKHIWTCDFTVAMSIGFRGKACPSIMPSEHSYMIWENKNRLIKGKVVRGSWDKSKDAACIPRNKWGLFILAIISSPRRRTSLSMLFSNHGLSTRLPEECTSGGVLASRWKDENGAEKRKRG